MKKIIVAFLLSSLFSMSVLADKMHKPTVDGMVVKVSANSVTATMDRLEKILNDKGITVFLRVDHAQAAQKIGHNLRDTQLLIFGNPKLGSPLMLSQQTIAVDLPLKALVWKDSSGKVWLAYNDPAYLSKRHNISDRAAVFTKMTKVLNKLTNYAVGK
ncbi:MAG: DUF302 domain-containing protein [Pseudomonadota bacterium]